MMDGGKVMGAGARAISLIGRGALLGVLLLARASCGTTRKPSRPCPVVRRVPDASYLARFAGDSEYLTATAYEAKLAGVKPLCKYSEDTDTGKTTIISDLL